MRKNSGFTLAELMVTIGIIAIVAAIAIPGYLSWLPDHRLRSAVMDLEGNIQWTRLQAIKNNRTWAVIFDQANNIYYICSNNNGTAWDGPVAMGGNDTLERTVRLADYNAGVNFTAVNAPAPPPPAFTFSYRGTAGFNYNVSLANRNNASSYRVNVSFAGGASSIRL